VKITRKIEKSFIANLFESDTVIKLPCHFL
jgi:hypothetical protein